MLLPLLARISRMLPPVRGRGRVALTLHRRRRVSVGAMVVQMRRGFSMVIPVNAAQSWSAAFTGSYDDEELELLIEHVTTRSLILDVGSSLGFYTVPLALAARRREGHVVAIDPVGANCAMLRRNLERNGLLDTVTVLQTAVGASRREVLLHVETGGTGNATIVNDLPADEVARHDRAGKTGSTERAQLQTLDELDLSSGPGDLPCVLIKIDAEGFEMDILAGGEDYIRRHRPVIFGEFNLSWLRTRGVDPAAPLEWATLHDYDCAELVYARNHLLSERHSISCRPLDGGRARSGTGLLFTPRDRPTSSEQAPPV